jgi:hypothetical protein
MNHSQYICDNCLSTEIDPAEPCGCGKGMWLKLAPERIDPPDIYTVLTVVPFNLETCTQLKGLVQLNGEKYELLLIYSRGTLTVQIDHRNHLYLQVSDNESNFISNILLIELTKVKLDWSKYSVVDGKMITEYELKVKKELEKT